MFPMPASDGNTVGIDFGPDGAMWLTFPSTNRFGRMTMKGQLRAWNIPGGNVCPFGIARGAVHDQWLAEYCGSGILRIDPRGKVKSFPLPSHQGTPQWITLGSDNAMWFTTFSGGASDVGRVQLLDKQ